MSRVTSGAPSTRSLPSNLSFGNRRENVADVPYWHIDGGDPVLHGLRVDPGYQRLTRGLGDVSARHLLDAGFNLTGLAHLTYARPFGTGCAVASSCQLIADTAASLRLAADSMPAARGDLSDVVRRSASWLETFSIHSKWPRMVIEEPLPDGWFFYCGPLNTWRGRCTESPITMLIGTVAPTMQAEVDRVTHKSAHLLAELSSLTGIELQHTYILDEEPAMYALDLVHIAGDGAMGHKNFAHFLPLEVPGGVVRGKDFTVVFANVLASRLAHVTRRIAERLIEPTRQQQVGKISLATGEILKWFRGHDLAHFVRPSAYAESSQISAHITDFARITLDEAIADAAGIVAIISEHRNSNEYAWHDAIIAVTAELHRYAARANADFADAAAATIFLGYLSATLSSDHNTEALLSGITCNGRRDVGKLLGPYLRTLYLARYRGSEDAIHETEAWAELGTLYMSKLQDKILDLPSDHHYVEG